MMRGERREEEEGWRGCARVRVSVCVCEVGGGVGKEGVEIR